MEPGGQTGIAVLVQGAVMHRPAALTQRGREVTHSRQKKRGALLVRAHMGRFLQRLDHQNLVAGRVGIAQGRGLLVELIA